MPKSLMRRTSMAMCSDTLGRAQFPTVEWKSFRQPRDLLANCGRCLFRPDIAKHFGDQLRYRAHLRLAESARGDGGRSKAHAAGIHGRIGVERNRVAIGGDAGVLQSRLGVLAAHSL